MQRFRKTESVMVAVVQLVRASDCGSECRRFESDQPPQEVGNFKVPYFFIYISGLRFWFKCCSLIDFVVYSWNRIEFQL